MNNKKRKISTISEIKKRIQKFNNVENNQKPNYWIYVFRLSSEDLIFALDQIMIYYPWISVDQKLFLKHFKEYKSKYVLLISGDLKYMCLGEAILEWHMSKHSNFQNKLKFWGATEFLCNLPFYLGNS